MKAVSGVVLFAEASLRFKLQFTIQLTIRCFLPEVDTFKFEVFMVFCNIRI